MLPYFKDWPHCRLGPTVYGMADCVAENRADSCCSGCLAILGELIDRYGKAQFAMRDGVNGFGQAAREGQLFALKQTQRISATDLPQACRWVTHCSAVSSQKS